MNTNSNLIWDIMVIKVGINGFGRIGRIIFRTCFQNHEIVLSAINDPAIDIEYICYLIKFDSTHGKFRKNIEHTDREIIIEDQRIQVFREKLPPDVPWQRAGVEFVIEASGMFTSQEKASGHLASEGVKRVIVTAPSVDVPMIILGVNDSKLHADHKVLSCASSTLYCLAPIIKVLHDNFGVQEGFITSIHAMTPSLKPLDGLCLRGKHWRDHRSIHQNIIPANTGACNALGKIIPQVKDKMTGLAFRVPIVNVSVLDITIRLDASTSLHEIAKAVETASNTNLHNIIKLSSDNAVSSDFIGDSHSCILDVNSSLQLRPNFFKLICWYENEYSYACRVLDSIFFSVKQFSQSKLLTPKMVNVRPKVIKKQDVEQTKRSKREMSVKCHYKATVPKILSSSTDATLKKSNQKCRPLYLQKQLYTLSGSANMPVLGRDSKKGNETFKIWNDGCEPSKNSTKQNRGSFFHSCTSFSPNNDEKTECLKAHERLENIKNEFSKMLDITENLLKKSCSAKMQLEAAENSTEGINISSDIESKEATVEDTDSISNRRYFKEQKICAIFKECGDFKNKDKCNVSNDSSQEPTMSFHGKHDDIVQRLAKKVRRNDKNQPEETIIEESQSKSCMLKDLKKTKIIKIAENSEAEIAVSKVLSISSSLNNCGSDVEVIGETINSLPHAISTKSVKDTSNELNRYVPLTFSTISSEIFEEDDEYLIKTIEGGLEPDPPCETNTCDTQTSVHKPPIEDEPEKINLTEFTKYLDSKNYNMQIIDEELKKRNIVLVTSDISINMPNIESERATIDADDHHINIDMNKQILDSLSRIVTEARDIVPDLLRYSSSANTATTISNGDRKPLKLDLYDKLDSDSATDSDNSFEINERKSQVIHITDLTNSLEDLSRLDKICRIIEISDELSDKLFSKLDSSDISRIPQGRKWSFRDLCERIQLDDFCNKVFGGTYASLKR